METSTGPATKTPIPAQLLTPSQERIVTLLGQGLSAEVVATAVGCDPSYISQLLSQDEIHKRVSELRVQSLQAATKRDNKWDSIEDKLLDAMSEKVDNMASFMKPGDLIRFLSVVNAAKRRGAQAQDAMTINNTTVNLTIPQRALQQFVVNSVNQVVQVGEQTLLTLPSQNIKALAANLEQKEAHKAISTKALRDDIIRGNISQETGV